MKNKYSYAIGFPFTVPAITLYVPKQRQYNKDGNLITSVNLGRAMIFSTKYEALGHLIDMKLTDSWKVLTIPAEQLFKARLECA